jgi:hypothetical protein
MAKTFLNVFIIIVTTTIIMGCAPCNVILPANTPPEGFRFGPDGPDAKHQGPKPPPEAYTVCKGKKPGDTARLTTPRGDTIEGTCEEMDGQMVLKPNPPKDRHNPVSEKSGRRNYVQQR